MTQLQARWTLRIAASLWLAENPEDPNAASVRDALQATEAEQDTDKSNEKR